MLLSLRRILRSMRNAPGFTAVAVATIALAIGANTAIFSVIDAALLRPLPFPEAGRLVAVWEKTNLFGLRYSPVALANFVDWRAQSVSFQELGVHESGSMLLAGEGDAEEVDCGLVSAGLFRALQVQPLLGRFWAEDEDRPGASKTVVLGHGVWKRRYAADPQLLGKTILLGSEPYTVIGIMPPGFAVPGQTDALWIPLGALYNADALRNRQRHNFFVAGRLGPGVTLAQANADLDAVAARLRRDYPDSNADIGSFASPIGEHVVGKVRPLYLLLAVAVGLLLFTACANLANLMLARFIGRAHETAVLLALGAGTRHLLGQSLLEAAVLGVLGGATGLLVAVWSMQLLRPLVPAELAEVSALQLDWRVLGFALAATLVTILLIGCAPLWRIARRAPLAGLREGSGRTGQGAHDGRLQGGLVAVQLALSFTLVVGAGLLLRTFAQLRSADLGFRTSHVVVARFAGNAFWSQYGQNRDKRGAFYRETLGRVASLPGVETVGFTNGVPLLNKGNMAQFAPERPLPAARPGDSLTVNRRTVSPGYFAALGVPLLRGRALAGSDTAGQPPVAVVNAAFARRFWPDLADPLGQRIRNGDGPWISVVGIVGDMRQKGVDQAAAPEVYIPCDQLGEPAMMLVVRTTSSPEALAPMLRRELAAINPSLPVVEFTKLDDILDGELSSRRLQTVLLGAFAALTLVVAALGLYGVVAYAVARRTREFGIRTALGATRCDILSHVLRRNLRLLVPGLALGIGIALLLARLMAGMLYGIAPYDPATFASAAVLLLLSATLACWLPARRATRIDPMVALRAE